jgi:hypothetical protein
MKYLLFSFFLLIVHLKQQVTVGGVLAQIQELAFQGIPLRSGVISENTHFIFRSRSTRIIWLVQISSEMWEYDEKGDLYFEKFLIKFVEPVIDLWKSLAVTHSLMVVFFARSIIQFSSTSPPTRDSFNTLRKTNISEKMFRHEDYFKIVIENVQEADKQTVLRTLRKEFWAFPSTVGWNLGIFEQMTSNISSNNQNHNDSSNSNNPG